MKTSKTSIDFSSVTAGYGDIDVLSDVDLDLETGFTVLLGPNGCGKTTLFRVGAGILEPDRGEVSIGGRNPHRDPSVKRSVSYLPHRPVLQSSMTVRQNLQFWGRVHDLDSAQVGERIETLAERFEFTDLLDRNGNKLSRGQGQRVSIGQALLSDPSVLFLDEATTGLDPMIAGDIRSYLRTLGDERTVVYSTHNLTEADELADRLVIMQDGRIGLDSSMEEVRNRHLSTSRIGVKTSSDPQDVLEELGYDAQRDGQYWVVDKRPDQDTGELAMELTQRGLNVKEVRMMDNTVESVYEEVELRS
ncbi:ABC transporter ATP-binding protein [Halorussus halobius]|uniref:ABC transporter ATP-binding protein n=1 Tax=Halorussus halobius TaxID=1710537 RepID=UPI00109308D6|nr:ABC transporter ATP-binding protein [Halorussus halobius]